MFSTPKCKAKPNVIVPQNVSKQEYFSCHYKNHDSYLNIKGKWITNNINQGVGIMKMEKTMVPIEYGME
jgi:hypothetical protein